MGSAVIDANVSDSATQSKIRVKKLASPAVAGSEIRPYQMLQNRAADVSCSLQERLAGSTEGLRAFYPRGSDRLDTRSAGYKRLPLLQSGPPTSYQYPGFRFAPPWAEASYAFGVFSDPPPNKFNICSKSFWRVDHRHFGDRADPIIHHGNFNPNSDFRNLPFGPKPVLRRPSEHLFGVKPRHVQRNKFVRMKAETLPCLTRQSPKLPKATSESGFNNRGPHNRGPCSRRRTGFLLQLVIWQNLTIAMSVIIVLITSALSFHCH